MPWYFVFIKVSKEEFHYEGMVHAKRNTTAWNQFKSKNKKGIDSTSEYHLFTVKHARKFKMVGKKWKMNSHFGNHKIEKK